MARTTNTQIFRGSSLTEAVLKAKKEFGNDFSIVTRRDVREANLFSKLTSGKLGGDNVSVELEVAPGPPRKETTKDAAPLPPEAHPLLRSYTKAMEGAERHAPEARALMTAAAAPYVSLGESSTGIAGRLDEFQRELERTTRESAALREELRLLVSLQARGGVPAVHPCLLDEYRVLTANGVEDGLAREIVEEAQNRHPALAEAGAARQAVREAVAKRFPAAGPLLPREEGPTVVAFVGASGVGKTTSMAKMAIHFTMTLRKSVGIINEDRRRPGAEAQVNNLNLIFRIPAVTATEPEEIVSAMRGMAGRDVIILDTGGRSPKDAGGIEKLAAVLRAAAPQETYLLQPAVHSAKAMRETAAAFRPAAFNRVIFTKLDEAGDFGSLLNVAAGLPEGLAYVCCDPTYTRPIHAADPEALAGLVLGGGLEL